MTAPFKAPFPEIIPATFLRRPNRFVLEVRLQDGKQARAFLPNPGRLQELLLPQTTVYLAPAKGAPERKTSFTAIGVAGEKHPIFLHTHVTNTVARYLLETRQVPGLNQATILRAEAPLGRSRFDFLLQQRGKPLYLEVKSCTLFGNRGAMFPDAVTERGRRHLEELATLARSGVRTAVLFVVHSNEVDWFMPDYHTDTAFSRTLLEVRDDVQIIPLAVGWNSDFTLIPGVRSLPIPWRYIEREIGDRGNYILLFRSYENRKNQKRVSRFYLYAGWCGEAMRKSLQHGAARKRPAAVSRFNYPEHFELLETFPIVSSRNRLKDLLHTLGQYGKSTSLGGSDTLTPLFLRTEDPRDDREFHRILAQYRMEGPRVPK